MAQERRVARVNWRTLRWTISFIVIGVGSAVGLCVALDQGEFPAALSAVLVTCAFVLALALGHFLGSSELPDIDVPQDTVEATTRLLAGIDPADALRAVLDEWKQVTDVQMHFNEMIIRMRTLAVSVVITVFGGAGFTVARYPDEFIYLGGRPFHISVFVTAAGLALWLTIFVIDYCYYYKLLLGAVRRGYAIDRAFANSPFLGGLRLFGSARLISAAIGRPGDSEYVVWAYYGIVYFAGVGFMTTVMIVLQP